MKTAWAKRNVGLLALAASVLLHALIELFMPHGSLSRGPEFAKARSTIEFELEPLASTSLSPSPTPLSAIASSPSESSALARGRPLDPGAPSSAGILIDAAEAPAPAAAPPAVCNVPSLNPGLLDPRSVALGAEGIPSVPSAGDAAALAGANMRRYLHQTANARDYLTRRPPPALRRQADGTYAFSNVNFRAEIDEEGNVTFHDQHVSGPVPDARMQGEGPADTTLTASLGIGFDLTEEWMRANGQDPLRNERAWFMEGTQELRDRLHAQASARYDTSSLSALVRRLGEISGNGRLSIAQKHQAVFDVWDDCATDAIGDRAREEIVTFIADHFPAGTQLAFTETEIRAFNQRSASPVPFAPYARTAPDAGQG